MEYCALPGLAISSCHHAPHPKTSHANFCGVGLAAQASYALPGLPLSDLPQIGGSSLPSISPDFLDVLCLARPSGLLLACFMLLGVTPPLDGRSPSLKHSWKDVCLRWPYGGCFCFLMNMHPPKFEPPSNL